MIRILKFTSYVLVWSALFSAGSFATPSYDFNPGRGWKPARMGDSTGWMAAGDKATIFVYSNSLESGVFSLQPSDAPKLVKLLEEMKQFRSQGVTAKAWKVRKYGLTSFAGGKGSLLKLQGDYTNMLGKKVRFIEWHYYVGSDHYRIVYSQDQGAGAWSEKKIESILGQFHPTGVSS